MAHPTARFRAATRFVAALTLALALIIATTSAHLMHPAPASALGTLGSLGVGANPQGVAVNAAGTLGLVTNAADGTVSVIQIDDQFTVVDTITVGGEPTGVAFSPDGTEAWVATWAGNAVKVIDIATMAVTATISAGAGSYSVTFSHDGATAWVINYNGNSVAVVDVAGRTVLRTISGLSNPQNAVLSADGLMLYVTATGGTVTRISTADDSITELAVSGFPLDIVFTPSESHLWVTNNATSALTVIDVATFSVIETLSTQTYPGGITVSPDEAQMLVATEHGIDIFDIATRTLMTTITTTSADNYDIVTVPGKSRVLVAQRNLSVVAVLGFDQERLAGADRYSTAVEVSQKGFPTGTSTVFVANGLNFPDALAAGPAAGLLDASLLLTNPTTLPTVVSDEITRLNPDTIYIVGGTSAVSASVEAALAAIQPNVIRLAGSTRYATGAAIVDEAWSGLTVPEVFIATGRNYPDALSAGAVAAAEGIPVILIDGALSSVPQATLNQIALLAPTQITIAGGTGAVSADIETQLAAEFSGVRRLAGADRYTTSAAINLDAYPTNSGVIYATGASFADALAGAALAGRAQFPVYLVNPTCVTAGALSAIYQGQATNLFLLGGTAALSTAVENLTAC